MALFLFLITVTVLAGAMSTAYAILRDGRGPSAPPSSHSVDPAFLPPASLAGRR